MTVKRQVLIQASDALPIGQQPFELVERKGLGHPDTICDSVMETACLALCREYRERCGRVLHHNLDKALLVAGRSIPRLGVGGKLLEPIRLVLGDRATTEFEGTEIPVGEIVENAAREWLGSNLRFVEPDRHLIFQNEIKSGSAELTDLFTRKIPGANDTSVGVGYAPLSETEELVIATERFLNSPSFKSLFPETGEDVKVMACRTGRILDLTVAVAFIDRFLKKKSDYFDKKQAIREKLAKFLDARDLTLDKINVSINTLDDPDRGESGLYLTVLGTSAEGADGGEVGRGNRASGVISFNRPASSEAVAGKNPVSHVGKIYNVLSNEIAGAIHRQVVGIREVTVWLCSRIGVAIDQPLLTAARVVPAPGVALPEIEEAVREVIDNQLAGIDTFTARLTGGKFPVAIRVGRESVPNSNQKSRGDL